MAKLSITVTFTVIFSLFLLSHARIPSNQPSNLVAEYKPDEEKKESFSSEVSESTPVQTVDLPSDAIRALGINRPLTITFDVGHHPFNHHVHHMHMRHPFWFRRLPHRCRHHDRQTEGPREISYGNDMLYPDRVGEKPLDKTMNPRKGNAEELSRKNFEEFLAMGVLTNKEGIVDGEEFADRVKPMEKRKKEGGLNLMKTVRKFLHHFDF